MASIIIIMATNNDDDMLEEKRCNTARRSFLIKTFLPRHNVCMRYNTMYYNQYYIL